MVPNLGDRYHFFEQIPFARGGTADIYRALDRYRGEIVIVKAIRANLFGNNEAKRRLVLEANILIMLEHNNIVKLKDYAACENSFCLVLEYVEGYSLQHYIDNITGPIKTKTAIELMAYILGAIDYAHNRRINISGFNGGVLHLDIKPANILLNTDGSVKLIDFGISEGSETKRNSVVGSPMYMAPEQFDINEKMSVKTDVYSLGTLFHKMITGKFPYNACDSMPELKQRIISTQTDRIVSLYPHVEKKFQSIIDTATEKNPRNRFSSCAEMRSEILKLA